MKTKKLLSVLLSLLMLAGIFSVNASAADADDISDTDIIIAGTVIDGTKESRWLTVNGALTANGASASNYNIAITPAKTGSAAKVTLKNAQINKVTVFDEDIYAGIYSDRALDIELQGTNSFDILPDNYGSAGGIAVPGTKIYGSGSLSMNIGNEYSEQTYGICVRDNALDISGSVAIKLNLKAFDYINGTLSIDATTLSDNASLEINETCVKAASGSANELWATGCETWRGGLKLSDNAKINIKITDPVSAAKKVYGLDTEGGVELSGNSHINADCCGATESSIGIYNENGNLTLSGSSTATVKSGNAETSHAIKLYAEEDLKATAALSGNSKLTATTGSGEDTCGMMIKGNLIASDNSSIKCTAGKSKYSSYGIATDNITLSGSAKINASASDSQYVSMGIFNSGNITASGDSYISAKSGIVTDDGSCGISTAGLTMSDYAEISATGKSGKYSYGVYAVSFAAMSGESTVEAHADTATEFSCGFYAYKGTITDSAHIFSTSEYAANSFGAAFEEANFTSSAEVDGRADFGTEKSCGIFLISKGFISCDDGFIAGSSDGSEKYAAGIHFEGDITVSGSSYVFGAATSAPESYGIVSKTLTVSSDAVIDARGETQAIYRAVPNLDGYEDALVEVSTTTDYSETEWDGTTPLGGEDSTYKNIFIEKAPFKLELNFFQQILLNIALFFAGISQFFESLFSF